MRCCRHCEKSKVTMDCFVALWAPRNDEQRLQSCHGPRNDEQRLQICQEPRNDVLGLLQGKAFKLVCAAADKLKVQFADSIRKAYVCCKGFPDI